MLVYSSGKNILEDRVKTLSEIAEPASQIFIVIKDLQVRTYLCTHVRLEAVKVSLSVERVREESTRGEEY